MYLKRTANGRTFQAETGANGIIWIYAHGENYEVLDCTGNCSFKELSEHADYILNYDVEKSLEDYWASQQQGD